jgi:methyl-accepting chemotaxis protein
MTRLSSLFDSGRSAIAVCSIALIASAYAVIGGLLRQSTLPPAAVATAFVASAVLLLLLLRNGAAGKRKPADADADTDVIDKIATVCSEISHGNFEARIARITEPGKLGEVQHKVNDMIDRCDAFVREATACMEAVCRNVYYRTILYGGLQGSFRVAAKIINDSVAAQGKAVEKARQDAAAEQARIVETLAGGLKKLSDGDLTFRLTDFPEKYGQVRDDFNSAMTRLHETTTTISTATTEVSNATAELSTSTTDLSQRTEEQAASLEQTSASMEEISATVKKNAENAQQANQSAGSARKAAEHGGQVVAQVVDAMARIEQASRKISDIIGVIDEIARQTNLLALNAAVEAARAGDAGRGFAVVASEVRSLAQRSSQAAKDVKDLIGNSNTQVKGGVELVNKAGAALNEIVDSIKSVAAIVADIATASSEQSSGIDQINIALTQMDEATQQNSALVEENAATAKMLEEQARTMDTCVGFFKLDPSAVADVSERAAGEDDDAELPARRRA